MILLTRSHTEKHACPGAAGVLHGNASILQRPVDTLKQLLLLRVHLFHLAVADPEKLVVEFVKPEEQMGILKSRNGLILFGVQTTYPSMSAALAVRDFPALLSSGSYQLATSNLSLEIGTAQFFPSTRTFQKLSSPSPVGKEACWLRR